MKISGILFSSFLFTVVSCNNNNVVKNNKEILPDPDIKKELRSMFDAWKVNELELRHLWSADSCNSAYFTTHKFEGGLEKMWGLPADSNDYHFSFADINNDRKLDLMVTFNPCQCDGGNASMWTQLEVLVVSDPENYHVESLIGDGLMNSTGIDTNGFYWFDSIGVNMIYATYYQFKKEDNHCCPSIQLPVKLSYPDKKLMETAQ